MINSQIASMAFNQGLDALGLASGLLAQNWTNATPAYDPVALSLSSTSTSPWLAMTGGVFIWQSGAPDLSDVTGTPLTGIVGVFSLHPQAALRIRRLVGKRFDGRTDGLALRPTPFYAAIRDGEPPSSMREDSPPLAPINPGVGGTLSPGRLTFHDEQGLIIDPVAVACLFYDLSQVFPALDLDNQNSGDSQRGSLANISDLSSFVGRKVHIINPFGATWKGNASRMGLRFGDGTRLNNADNNVYEWPDGQPLQTTGAGSGRGDLHFGFSPQGTLDINPLQPLGFPSPSFPENSSPPNLKLQFFRVIAVDLGLHLCGNRSGDTLEGVNRVDDASSLEPAPLVREGDTVEFLRDGQAMIGAVSEVAALGGFRLAVSPVIATDVNFPLDRTSRSRWPETPAMTEEDHPQELTAEISRQARIGMTAAYVGTGPDIVMTWPPGSLPAEAHVRVFPRVDPGGAIVPLAELEFSRRGDGGAGIAKPDGLALLVKNPFRVNEGGTSPMNPTLRFDLLIVTRVKGNSRGHLIGGLEVGVGSGAAVPVEPDTTNLLRDIPANQRGVSPAPLIGLTPTSIATGSDPVLSALGEAAPRESPRFRTMARLESMMAGHDGNNPGAWQAVLTSGLLNGRSVRGDADLGNPGNPAGPEDHAPGVSVNGKLALDLARAASRRTHHLSTRLLALDAEHWNDAPTSMGTDSFAGAVLQNVADTVESPELSLIPEGVLRSLPTDWNALINALQDFLPNSLASLLTEVPVPGAGDRWVEEVRREAFAAKYGRRDSQWAWRWVISHARSLIYLETALFGATSADDPNPATGLAMHEVDLVELLRQRLSNAPGLRVIIATPKRIPFGPGYESFAEYFYQARKKAFDSLKNEAPKRVMVFHPVGFPGRPEVLRGSVAVVDDVWALLGSSTFSRRGLSFDGSIDLAFMDKTISHGVSKTVRELRRSSMARILGLAPVAPGETEVAGWVRLRQPASAFKLMQEILARGGDGLVEPLWAGLPEIDPLSQNIADPDGRNFSNILGGFAELLSGLGSERV